MCEDAGSTPKRGTSAGVERSLSTSVRAARALSFSLPCRHFLFLVIGFSDLLLFSFSHPPLLNALCIRHRTSQLGCACIPDWDVIASGHTDRATNVAAAHLR